MDSRSPGKVIGFSGIDGCGKSTQVTYLWRWLDDMGVPALATKVPPTSISTFFRLSQRLFGDPFDYHPKIPATLRELAVACDVENHYLHTVEPIARSGTNVIQDRSLLCYESYARAYGADLTWISEIYNMLPKPDIVFFLEVPVYVALERIKKRQFQPLRSDENSGLLESVHKAFLDQAKLFPRLFVIDGEQDEGEIHSKVRSILLAEVPSMFTGATGATVSGK